jgi:N-acetylglutamate synthase-like GNAT family acetyltransferase
MPTVRSWEEGDREAVIALVLTIQNEEYDVGITLEEQPDLLDVRRYYFVSGGHFWVALRPDNELVGCIGLHRLTDQIGVLKKFFVHASDRGPTRGHSEALFQTLVRFARDRGLLWIMLDSPGIATRSHAFYLRKGFVRVNHEQLPVA